MLSLISFLLVMGVCVIIHEGGHYLTAIWRDVQVHEFAFGMGPALISRRRNGVLWSLRCFPIGGFVRLEGMEEDPLPEDDPDPERSFTKRRAWERALIIAGGALANIFLAWVLTVCLLMFNGVLDGSSLVIGKVLEDHPAMTMGTREGDKVLSINEVRIDQWRQIREQLQQVESDEIVIGIERDGREIELRGTIPFDEESGVRMWGVMPARVRYGPIRASLTAIRYAWEMSVEILTGLWKMITGALKAEVAGPVGIAVMAGDAAKQGFWTFISFLAVINLNLGLLNLLPLPALDGGHLVFIAAEALFGRKVPEKLENKIHIIGLAVLLCIIAIVTFQDIRRLIG